MSSARAADADSADRKDAGSLHQEQQDVSSLAEATPEVVSVATLQQEESIEEQLRQDIANTQDRLLRALADLENLRRRSEREKAEATLYAATGFARSLLPVADNLERALGVVFEDHPLDPALKGLLEGVELTYKELLSVFERHNISRIEAEGEKFDPHLHQAIFEVPEPNAPSGIVSQVVQQGYKIGDRVLRPAMVGVTKASP